MAFNKIRVPQVEGLEEFIGQTTNDRVVGIERHKSSVIGDVVRINKPNNVNLDASTIGFTVVDARSASALGADGDSSKIPNTGNPTLNHTILGLFNTNWNGFDNAWGTSIIAKGWQGNYAAWSISGYADGLNIEYDFYVRQSNPLDGTWYAPRRIWTDKHFNQSAIDYWNTSAGLSHWHDNKPVLDTILDKKISQWENDALYVTNSEMVAYTAQHYAQRDGGNLTNIPNWKDQLGIDDLIAEVATFAKIDGSNIPAPVVGQNLVNLTYLEGTYWGLIDDLFARKSGYYAGLDVGNADFADNAHTAVNAGNWGVGYTNVFGGISGATGIDHLYGYNSSTGHGHILTPADFRTVLGVYDNDEITELLNDKITGSGSPSNPKNFNFAIGTDGTRNFIQSHSSQPLDLNPLGNVVTINGYDAWHFGNFDPNTKANISGYYGGLTVGRADFADGLKGSGGQDTYGGSVVSSGLQYVLGIHATTGIYKFDANALNTFLGTNTSWNLQQVTDNGNTHRKALIKGWNFTEGNEPNIVRDFEGYMGGIARTIFSTRAANEEWGLVAHGSDGNMINYHFALGDGTPTGIEFFRDGRVKFKGTVINDRNIFNPNPFFFLNADGGFAQHIATGGVLVSGNYSNIGLVPTSGMWVEGLIQTGSHGNSEQWNAKVTNMENAIGIGFSNGNFSDAPYFYHNVSGYRFLATQEWVNNNFTTQSQLGNYVDLTTNQNINGIKNFNSYFSSYTSDGLFDISNMSSSFRVATPSASSVILGYRDLGTGQYFPRIGFHNNWSGVKWDIGSKFDYFSIGKNNDNIDIFSITEVESYIRGNVIWHQGNLTDPATETWVTNRFVDFTTQHQIINSTKVFLTQDGTAGIELRGNGSNLIPRMVFHQPDIAIKSLEMRNDGLLYWGNEILAGRNWINNNYVNKVGDTMTGDLFGSGARIGFITNVAGVANYLYNTNPAGYGLTIRGGDASQGTYALNVENYNGNLTLFRINPTYSQFYTELFILNATHPNHAVAFGQLGDYALKNGTYPNMSVGYADNSGQLGGKSAAYYVQGDTVARSMEGYDIPNSGNWKPTVSGFYRHNGNYFGAGGNLIWAAHTYYPNGEYGAGIAIDYGGQAAYLVGRDGTGAIMPVNRIVTENMLSPNYGNFKDYGLGTLGDIPFISDLNALIRAGFYAYNGASNAPYTYGNVIRMNRSNTESTEVALDVYGNSMAFRAQVGGVFAPWRYVYHDGNFNPTNKANTNGDNVVADSLWNIYSKGIYSPMPGGSSSDFFRIIGLDEGGDMGAMEIATADNGDEPIYVRQYSYVGSSGSGVNTGFGTLINSATLLDRQGNTHFPKVVDSQQFIATNGGFIVRGNNGVNSNTTKIFFENDYASIGWAISQGDNSATQEGLGFGTWDGSIYKDLVRIHTDGNIITESFGSASDWNRAARQTANSPLYARRTFTLGSGATGQVTHKIKFDTTAFAGNGIGGTFKITITGSYHNAHVGGRIETSYYVLANPNSLISQGSRVGEAYGAILNDFYIDRTISMENEFLVFKIHKKGAAGNPCYVSIEFLSTGQDAYMAISNGTIETVAFQGNTGFYQEPDFGMEFGLGRDMGHYGEVNWNGATKTGFYSINDGVSGTLPFTYGSLIRAQKNGTEFMEIAGDVTAANFMIRNQNSGWKKLILEQDMEVYDHRRYYTNVGVAQFLGAQYAWYGSSPAVGDFKPGTLALAMGNGITPQGYWNDILWLSSYTGGDVPLSTAIVSSKGDHRIGYAKQNWNSGSWGFFQEFITTENLGNGLDWDGDKLNVIGGGSGVNSIAPQSSPQNQLMGDILFANSGLMNINYGFGNKLITFDVTPYIGGTGIDVTGNVVRQLVTTTGSGNVVTSVQQTTNGFQVNYGTVTANIPIATTSVLGGVKDGNGVNIAADGTLSVSVGTSGSGNVVTGIQQTTTGISYTMSTLSVGVTAVSLNLANAEGLINTGTATVTSSGTFALAFSAGYSLVKPADRTLLTRLERLGKTANYTSSSTAVVNTSANDGLVEYKRIYYTGFPCAGVTVRTDNPVIGDKIVIQGVQCDVAIRGVFSNYTLRTTRGNVTNYNHIQSCISNGVCIFELVYCDDGCWLMTTAECWGQF